MHSLPAQGRGVGKCSAGTDCWAAEVDQTGWSLAETAILLRMCLAYPTGRLCMKLWRRTRTVCSHNCSSELPRSDQTDVSPCTPRWPLSAQQHCTARLLT